MFVIDDDMMMNSNEGKKKEIVPVSDAIIPQKTHKKTIVEPYDYEGRYNEIIGDMDFEIED